MLEGWYCRTLNEQEQSSQPVQSDQNMEVNDETDSSASQDNEESHRGQSTNNIDYKSQYRYLKRKLKFLIYENEFFQDALRSNQRRLLKVSRDRAFLLDRLLQYEKPENTSSESEETEESSEDEATKEVKKRKTEVSASLSTPGTSRGRKKKIVATVTPDTSCLKVNPSQQSISDDRQQPKTEAESHLPNGTVLELMSDQITISKEMFSNEPSLDSEPNELLVECSSPSHVAAEECVPMEYSN
uniref:INO80 complex subunit E N-terminal domain-containing protein n=1 Tax=Musca domestica TaxID=7370 RepID=A0A1I8MVP0_MUSDO